MSGASDRPSGVLKYRLANRPGDLADVRLLRAAVYVDEEGLSADDAIDDLFPFEQHVLAYEHDKPVGVASFIPERDSLPARIGKVITLPSHRRPFLGMCLMSIAYELVTAAGGERIHAAVYRTKSSMIRMYQRMGFRQEESRTPSKHELVLDGPLENHLVPLRKRLFRTYAGRLENIRPETLPIADLLSRARP